jgi:ubiquinone/menaquinone biosynthesis C-methylase UbiE
MITEKVVRYYDRISKYYDLIDLLLFKFRYSEILDYFEFCDTALDIACGTGSMSFELTKRFEKVYGLDISRGMLNRAILKAENEEVHFMYGTGEYLPFRDECFDAVTCILAIDLFPNPEKAITEMKRVLKHRGILVVNLLELRDSVLKRVLGKTLQSIRREFSTALDSEKLLKSLSNAKRYERRDIIGPFLSSLCNNIVFVYRKRL